MQVKGVLCWKYGYETTSNESSGATQYGTWNEAVEPMRVEPGRFLFSPPAFPHSEPDRYFKVHNNRSGNSKLLPWCTIDTCAPTGFPCTPTGFSPYRLQIWAPTGSSTYPLGFKCVVP